MLGGQSGHTARHHWIGRADRLNSIKPETMKIETDREKLIRYCKEVNAVAEKQGHRLLWNIQGAVAKGSCDCSQRIEVGLDGNEELTHIGQPIKCPIIRS